MGKKYLTSDWHAGEQSLPHTHSYLRPRPTSVMIAEMIDHSQKFVQPDDTLIFLGDVGITLADLEVYQRLPACQKVLILGDKEYNNKSFTKEDFLRRNKELGIFDEVFENHIIEIRGRQYFLSHKPLDCLGQELPALCGHIHGIWRSAIMPNGQPIVNVGIDAWGGWVCEDFVEHQFNALTKHYDANAFPSKWWNGTIK